MVVLSDYTFCDRKFGTLSAVPPTPRVVGTKKTHNHLSSRQKFTSENKVKVYETFRGIRGLLSHLLRRHWDV